MYHHLPELKPPFGLGHPTIFWGSWKIWLAPLANTPKKLDSKGNPTYPWSIPQTCPNPQMKGIPNHKLLVGVWGMLQGSVGKVLDWSLPCNRWAPKKAIDTQNDNSFLRSHPHTPGRWAPQIFHQQFMFGNFFRIVGERGSFFGIIPGYVGKIVEAWLDTLIHPSINGCFWFP